MLVDDTSNSSRTFATVGLFAGIGGLEEGLSRAKHHPLLLVENFAPALQVLRTRFPEVKLEEDVRTVVDLPDGTELVVAGFPCQDLSSVGPKTGIAGTKSSLVGFVFELLARKPAPWLVLENVPFILSLDRGRALRLITSALDELGYRWCYRVVDTEAFGLPQRRKRWFLVASLDGDPRAVLLSDDAQRPDQGVRWPEVASGFYWTEGTRALGWAVDSVPPIKCGSSVGVASPPAIVLPSGEVVTPDLRDAERLQGFRADWTKPGEEVGRAAFRWRLVGNAVSVNVAEWIGRRLRSPRAYNDSGDRPWEGDRWPASAWSLGEGVFVSSASDTPVWKARPSLEEFLRYPTKPLSARAARGFLSRAQKGSLRFQTGFLDCIAEHVERQEAGAA